MSRGDFSFYAIASSRTIGVAEWRRVCPGAQQAPYQQPYPPHIGTYFRVGSGKATYSRRWSVGSRCEIGLGWPNR